MIGWLLKDYFWLLLLHVHTSFLHNWIVVHLAKGGTVSKYTVVAVCYVFFAICDEKKTSCSAKNLKYTFHFICCTIFLEGYLWDEGDPRKAFDKAILSANKVAMSLSDKFCVDRHKPHFLDLVKNKLDIVFANEEEIMSLINAKNFKEVIEFSKETKKLLVITRGEKGAISIKENNIIETGIKKDLNAIEDNDIILDIGPKTIISIKNIIDDMSFFIFI